MTSFLQVADNAKTRCASGALNNITSPITLNNIDTTKMPAVTTGYIVTIWDDLTYPDPGDDPNMEQATVTGRVSGLTGSLTLTRSDAKSHTHSPRIALLSISRHISDLNAAVSDIQTTVTVNKDLVGINSIQWNMTPTNHDMDGQTFWDANNMTLATNVGDGVTLQHGQELHVLAHNATGVTIPNGKVVYINGTNMGMPSIALAKADTASTSDGLVVGMTTQDIIDGSHGKVTSFGVIHDINTSSWAAGSVLYLSESVAGGLTATPPQSPNLTIKIGIVTYQDVTAGSILIDHSFSGSLADLSDVDIDGATNRQILRFNGADWENSDEVTAAGLDTEIQFNDHGSFGHSAKFTYDLPNNRVIIGDVDTVLPNNALSMVTNVDSYFQTNLHNNSAGINASSDHIITADTGTDTTGFVDFGINNSNYSVDSFTIGTGLDGYLYTQGGNTLVGTGAAGDTVKIFTGGTLIDNLSAEIDDDGINLPIGKTFRVNGVDITSGLVPKSGTTMTGQLIAHADTSYSTAQMRNVILSTADPSGGNNGDIWLKYTP